MTIHENANGKATKASVISIGLAAALLVGAIETTWRMAQALSEVEESQSVAASAIRESQAAGFAKIDGQIQLLKYQLEQQALQISDIRSFIGQTAPAKK